MTAAPPPSLRRRVEKASAPVLLWLSSRPKLVLPAFVVLLLVGGLAAPGAIGAVLLVVLCALLLWLSYLSWPALDTGARALRAAMLALVAVAVVQRLLG